VGLNRTEEICKFGQDHDNGSAQGVTAGRRVSKDGLNNLITAISEVSLIAATTSCGYTNAIAD